MNIFDILPEADPKDFSIIDFDRGVSTSGDNDYIFEKKSPYRIDEAKHLGGYYYQVKDKIYHAYFTEIVNADIETFYVLNGDLVSNVAKDKKHVYFRAAIVPEADAATFAFLQACFDADYYQERDHTFYAKDKNFGFYIDTIAKDIKAIKTKSLEHFRFEVINELGYAFDAQYSYLYGKRTKLK